MPYALRAVAAAGLTAVAALSFHRLLPAGPLAAAVGAGVVCALAVGLLLTRPRRVSPAVSLGVTAVLWLPMACLAIGVASGPATGYPAIGPAPTISSLTNLVHGVGGGWWRILTTVPPLGSDPAVLAAVSALSALASFGAVEMALRTKAVLPLAGFGLVVLVLGLLAGGPGSDVAVTVAFVVGTAVLTAVLTADLTAERAAPSASPAFRLSRFSRYAAGVPAVALIGSVALLFAAIGTSRAPFDPRRLVSPPPTTHPAVDPLQQAAQWVGTPNTRLFTLGGPAEALAGAPDLRLTVLDRFDGTAWSSDAVYTATGSRIPDAVGSPGPTTPASATTVREDVAVDQLSTLWLPAATRPTTISAPGSRLAVDGDGELLIPAGTRPGLHYAVTAQVAQYPEDELRVATPVPDAASTTLPGDVPQIITDTAQTATAGAGFPYQQAARLADYLRTSAVYDPTAPAGASYGHIAYFLGTSHRGGSDQFATAFALMARSLGLPARIAVGFAVSPTALAAARNAGAGTAGVAVTGADALVWPEVDFEGLGWVPFYPTPSGSERGGSLQTASGESAARQSVDTQLASTKLPDPKPLPHPLAGPSGAGTQARSRDSSTPMSPWPLVGATAIAVLALYLGYVLGLPELRRARRRRSQDPAVAVMGAWWETVALLRAMGLGAVERRTSAQIAAFGVGRLGGDGPRALSALARTVDFVAFAAAPAAGPASAAAGPALAAAGPASPAAAPTLASTAAAPVLAPAPTAASPVGAAPYGPATPTLATGPTPLAAFRQQAAAPRPTCDAALAAAAWADHASVRAAFRAAVPRGVRARRRLLPVRRRPRREA